MIKVHSGVDWPERESRSPLWVFAQDAFKKVGDAPGAIAEGFGWDGAFYGLDGCEVFQRATEANRQAILRRLAKLQLEEACAIEKAGMAYAAKMALLAGSIAERAYYSTIGFDEARHYAALVPYLESFGEPSEPQAFLEYLGETIETGARLPLAFIVQVVLEGWGLTHYRNLAVACGHAGLKETLLGILRDEARHHGGGMAIVEAEAPSAQERQEIVERLIEFLEMVAVGPVRVMQVVEETLGGFTASERRKLARELDSAGHAATRLAMLEKLIARADSEIANEVMAALRKIAKKTKKYPAISAS